MSNQIITKEEKVMLSKAKKIVNKGVSFAIKAMPVIIPALLIINANSVASSMNGQPTPPASLKNYRKF